MRVTKQRKVEQFCIFIEVIRCIFNKIEYLRKKICKRATKYDKKQAVLDGARQQRLHIFLGTRNWLINGEANCGTQIKLSSFLTSTIFILIAYNYLRNNKYEWKSNMLIVVGNYPFGIYLSHIMFMRIYSYIPLYRELPFAINSAIILMTSLLFVYYGSKIFNKKVCKMLGFM